MTIKRFSEFRKGNDRIKVYAKGFNSNRSVQLTGNVTGSAQSDMDEGTTLSISTTIADNAITNSKLSDGAVSTSKLHDDAVTSAKIDTGAVTVNKIGASAVETDKIANGAVTLNKISSSAIDNEPTDSSDNLITSGGVKVALDDKADKVSGATSGNLAGLDANGNPTDSGKKATDFVQSVKIGNGAELKDASGNVSLPVDATPTESSPNLMTSGDIKTAIDESVANLTYKQIPVGLKYDIVVTNETSTSSILCYEISNIGLTSQYSAATAEIVVYPYTAQGNVLTNITSYKVALHWDRASAICVVEGREPMGTWTAVVENSSTPSTTDVSTLKLYFVPKTYTTYRVSIVSCKRRGIAGSQYIFEGDISIKNEQENIPSPSSLVIVGTTNVKRLLSSIESPTNNNLVAMDGNGLVKDSGKSVLLGTQTWDGTSDDKLPTPKAVQGAIDAKVKGNSDVSSMGTDDTHAYSGKAVSTAISNAISGTTGGFLGEKTIAEMNAYANPKMGDNALISNTGTITVGNTPCVISQAPAEVRWTTDGSWIETSAGYVRDTKVATTQELGLVKTNPTDGGVILNNNNQMVVQGWNDKASASDVTSLTGRVTTAEGDIDALQASVAGKLNTSDAVWTIDDSDDAIIVDDEFMTWMFQA